MHCVCLPSLACEKPTPVMQQHTLHRVSTRAHRFAAQAAACVRRLTAVWFCVGRKLCCAVAKRGLVPGIAWHRSCSGSPCNTEMETVPAHISRRLVGGSHTKALCVPTQTSPVLLSLQQRQPNNGAMHTPDCYSVLSISQSAILHTTTAILRINSNRALQKLQQPNSRQTALSKPCRPTQRDPLPVPSAAESVLCTAPVLSTLLLRPQHSCACCPCR